MYQGYNVYNPYYAYNDYYYKKEYRAEEKELKNDELISYEEALILIKKSVGNEKEDEMFYTNLIEKAHTEQAKQIIKTIKDDEIKHNKLLRQVYKYLTGTEIPVPTNIIVNESKNEKTYKEELEKALMGELQAVVKYRRIMGAMPDDETYTTIMSIMTDELRHADKYNFLIHKAG